MILDFALFNSADNESEPYLSDNLMDIQREIESNISKDPQSEHVLFIVLELSNNGALDCEFDLIDYTIGEDLQQFILDEILIAYTDSIPPLLDRVSYIVEPELFVKHYEEHFKVLMNPTDPIFIELDDMKNLADLYVLVSYS